MSLETTPSKLNLPWKIRLTDSLIPAFNAAVFRRNGTVNRRLLSFFELKSPASTSSSVASSDIIVNPTRNLWLRLYAPATSTSHEDNRLPVMVYFHGGGFCVGSADAKLFDGLCRVFVEKLNVVIVSVNFRLAPEHKIPCQYDDGFDVLEFLDKNHNAILPRNADISKIFLIGDSSGANLAHHVAVRSCRASFGSVRIIGLIAIQPFYGGEERTESEKKQAKGPMLTVGLADWYWRAFLGEGVSRDNYAVNVGGSDAEDISGLEYPDTVVFVGGFDPLLDWQRRYHEWLLKAGKKATLIEYPNVFHGFYLFSELSEFHQLIQQMKDFVDKTVCGYA